MALYNCN